MKTILDYGPGAAGMTGAVAPDVVPLPLAMPLLIEQHVDLEPLVGQDLPASLWLHVAQNRIEVTRKPVCSAV